jgi:polyferredoxin
MSVNVLHERNPLFVLLADGGVRNDNTVRLLNKGPQRAFALDVSGLPGAAVHVSGVGSVDGKPAVEVGQDQTREIRMSILVSSTLAPQRPANIEIKATDIVTGQTASVGDHFIPASQ